MITDPIEHLETLVRIARSYATTYQAQADAALTAEERRFFLSLVSVQESLVTTYLHLRDSITAHRRLEKGCARPPRGTGSG